MPSKLIDRINKLIALSASSNENEARNAAFLAAKLIRENGVVLSEKGRAPEREDSELEDLMDFLRRQQRTTRPDSPPRPRPPPRPKEPPKKNAAWGTPKATPSRARAASQDELNDMFKDE